jgi:hypothetical protein
MQLMRDKEPTAVATHCGMVCGSFYGRAGSRMERTETLGLGANAKGRAVSPLPAVHSCLRWRALSDAPYPATRLISSSDAGFSKADVSPSFSPR